MVHVEKVRVMCGAPGCYRETLVLVPWLCPEHRPKKPPKKKGRRARR